MVFAQNDSEQKAIASEEDHHTPGQLDEHPRERAAATIAKFARTGF
jgi:hypothetical protein